MELRQLRYFCAVAETEHFHRAASGLRIAQPALSRQIRQLEMELGVDLFERMPRGVRLTEAGRQLLLDARRMLADADIISERARAAGQGETGRLRLGVAESASSRGKMVSSIIRFRGAFPKVQVELQHMTSLQQLEALTERRIDAAFLYHFPEARSDLMHLLAERTAILLAVPDNHPLARRERIRLADIAREEMVWIKRSSAPATYDKLMSACLKAGVSPVIAQEVTSESISLGLVSVGGLLSFVTDTNRERCPGNVALRKVDELDIEFQLELVWRASDRSPTLQRFVKTLTDFGMNLGPTA